MLMTEHEEEEDEIICDCMDRCCGLRLRRWESQFLVDIYWHGGFHQHRSRWKALWAVIRGKPFHVMELVLSEEDALDVADEIRDSLRVNGEDEWFRCYECGAENPPNTKRCQTCGVEVE